MSFNGFSKKGIEFLKEVEKNNTKEWFEAHRHIWQKEIRDKSISFVLEMGETLQILEPEINFEPKTGKSLFKIYRDTRFSKDKTPIKSKIGHIFWQGNGHKMQSSSFYLHYNKDSYFIASGIRAFKPPLLKKYREYIKNENHSQELKEILFEIEKKGYNLPTDRYKRVPKEFDEDFTFKDLTLFKSMFAYKEYMIDEIFFSDKIIDRCFNIYKDLHHLQKWVYKMTI